MFTFAGTMGKPSWQAAFTSLMGISQAFGIAATLTGFVIAYLLRLSPVYARVRILRNPEQHLAQSGT